jgi:hypothetical protein
LTELVYSHDISIYHCKIKQLIIYEGIDSCDNKCVVGLEVIYENLRTGEIYTTKKKIANSSFTDKYILLLGKNEFITTGFIDIGEGVQ